MVEDAGADELGDRVDETRAAQTNRLDIADHGQLDLGVDDPDTFDRPVGGAHATADLRRFERRASGCCGRERTRRRPEHDLGVRADVDEEAHSLVERQPRRQDARDDVGPDVGAERGKQDGGRALVHVDAEVGSGRLRKLPRRDREGRHRQRLRVDPQRKLDHRHVAGDDDLVDLRRVDARFLADLLSQGRERLVRLGSEHGECALIEHRGADSRDHVCTERLLRVQDRAHRCGLPGLEVEQRRDASRRTEVIGDGVAPFRRVAGLDVDQQIVDDDRGHVPVGLAQGVPEHPQQVEWHAELEVVDRVRHPLEIRDLIFERRLRELEMTLLHRRPEDDVPPDAGERSLRPRLEQRHLDDEILRGLRAAGQPPASLQLVGRERARIDRGDLLPAGRHAHLALLARTVPAAGRVDRDAVPARAVEEGRAGRHARLLRGAVGLLEDEPDAVRMNLLDPRRGRAHDVSAACFFR